MGCACAHWPSTPFVLDSTLHSTPVVFLMYAILEALDISDLESVKVCFLRNPSPSPHLNLFTSCSLLLCPLNAFKALDKIV